MKEAKDPYKKVDAEIDRVNRGKLKTMPVSLTRTGGSLYVQGTFPPKPGEQEPKQRRTPLKLSRSQRGEKRVALDYPELRLS